MTARKGKDLLLKVDSDGVGSFTTVAGLRARTLAFNAASVDVTDAESAGRWRELLEGAGLKTARISGSGKTGDSFTVTAGCDKTFRICRDKFDNKDNFRGFPHVPGNDFALSYPKRGKKSDGGSMN
jgi:uncharacterized phage protein (TIGR02218 family)